MAAPVLKKSRGLYEGTSCISDLLVIETGNSILLSFEEERVEDPQKFANIFKKGDKVVSMYFNADIHEAKNALKFLLILGQKYSKLGFAGIYGDTPNKTLLNAMEKKGGIIIETPEDTKKRVDKEYKKGVKKGIYPPEHRGNPVERIIYRFSDPHPELIDLKPLPFRQEIAHYGWVTPMDAVRKYQNKKSSIGDVI